MKEIGINEQIKKATTKEQLASLRHTGSTQYLASQKTLRRRAKLLAQKETK